MAVVTKSIGATGRDYSTITAWEADLDNGAVYSAGDEAVGECYDDADFIESVTLNGGATIGLQSVRLTVAAGSRHDGTAGTGARVTRTASAATYVFSFIPLAAGTDRLTVEWLDLDANGYDCTAFVANSGATAGRVGIARHLLMHGIRTGSAGRGGITALDRDLRVMRCILYDLVATGGNRSIVGLDLDSDTSDGGCLYNTVYKIVGQGTGSGVGIRVRSNDVDANCRGNISCGHGGLAPEAFDWLVANTLGTSSNNVSDDATADDGGGSGHIINATLADLFVSTVAGSEDLHLKDGSPAIDAGVDLGTTPPGVNIDINGRDVDAEGDTWDAGAHEYVSAGNTVTLTGSSASAAWAVYGGELSNIHAGLSASSAPGSWVVAGGSLSVTSGNTVTLAGAAASAQWVVASGALAVRVALSAPSAASQFATQGIWFASKIAAGLSAPSASAGWVVPTGSLAVRVALTGPAAVATWGVAAGSLASGGSVTLIAASAASAWNVAGGSLSLVKATLQAPAASAGWNIPTGNLTKRVGLVATPGGSTWNIPTGTFGVRVRLDAESAAGGWHIASGGLTIPIAFVDPNSYFFPRRAAVSILVLSEDFPSSTLTDRLKIDGEDFSTLGDDL